MSVETKANVDKIIQKYRFSTIKNIIGYDKDFWDTINAIRITAYKHTNEAFLKISYIHYTEQYNINDYRYHDDHDGQDDQDDHPEYNRRETLLEFGYNKNEFYINGTTPIRVYTKRDSPKRPIMYNDTYEHELDEYTQSILLDEYTFNKNIPEWFMIAFLKSIKSNIEQLINDLSFE